MRIAFGKCTGRVHAERLGGKLITISRKCIVCRHQLLLQHCSCSEIHIKITVIFTCSYLRQPPLRLALNFVRRYKWAFRPEYEGLRTQVAAPDLSAFADAAMVALKDKQEPLRIHFERARDQLAELNGSPVGAAGPWHETRLQVSRSLSAIAGELALAVPATIVSVTDFDAAKLDWARLSCRWFPGVSDV